MSEPEDRAVDEADELEPSFGADFVDPVDEDLADEVAAFEVDNQQGESRSAWQRLDARREEAWIKEQLSDWDDWDDDTEPH